MVFFVGEGTAGFFVGVVHPLSYRSGGLVKKESPGLQAEQWQSTQQLAGNEKPVIIEMLWIGRNHDITDMIELFKLRSGRAKSI